MKTIPSAEVDDTKAIGRPKSGKPWKKQSKPARALNAELHSMIEKPSFSARQQQKQHDAEAKAYEQSLNEAKNSTKRQAREKTAAKLKRKEQNQLRSGQYQLITNTKKIKKWSKKMRAELMRMPTEEYYRVMNKGSR